MPESAIADHSGITRSSQHEEPVAEPDVLWGEYGIDALIWADPSPYGTPPAGATPRAPVPSSGSDAQ